MKKKRVLACLLAVILFVSSIGLAAGAEEENTKEDTLAAPSAILMEANTGMILYEKQSG